MRKLADEVRARIGLDPRPMYRIALDAGVKPNWLYRFKLGIYQPGDENIRLRKVATELGIDMNEMEGCDEPRKN